MDAPTSSRSLDELAPAAGGLLERVDGDVATRVSGLAYDSRSIGGGELFFAVPGTHSDGHDYVHEALRHGAVALCVERSVEVDAPQVIVSDARRAMARIAAAFHGTPARELELIGITGTNGKTTTAYLVESILRAAGHTTGLIGTIETRIGTERAPGVRTTPESLDLQQLFARMLEHGVDAVSMEVTSHALVLHRVESVEFDAAVFTNLSQDHLDFHSDMEDYFAAKRSLFVPGRVAKGAVNVDDPYGRKLYESVAVECVGYGLSEDAAIRARAVKAGPWGTEFVVTSPWGELELRTTLVGSFNVSNCLAACAVALQAGVEPGAIAAGIEALDAVPGRFEPVDRGQPFTVVVDYAHTPDSLDNVLREARGMARSTQGRVVCVFGCGGDRDRAKRPLMGAVVARLADVVIVTSDNPRSEDPEAIIDHILEGVMAERADGPDEVIVDRRTAIERALGIARPKDVVVIAGKGHETGQQFADVTVPFDDRIVAAETLEAAGWDSAGGRAVQPRGSAR